VTSRPAPRDLRASDADRERVAALLSEAAADGRLSAEEHAERAGRAYAARTLGELAELTADLALPDAQPIRLDTRRSVTALFARERRDGRWVVPENLTVTALAGEVVLDLREALLQSRRAVIFATVICGTVLLIVPDGVAVRVSGRVLAGAASQLPPRAGDPAYPVIDVRAFVVGGRIKTVVPKVPRWRSVLRRGTPRALR
jgi:hypothetical protein